MRKFQRTDAPSFLKENAEEWGGEYARRKKENPAHRFQWKSFQGSPLNQKIRPLLSALTDDHCSYCDAYPPRLPDHTIDHFCPKGDERFYHLAYQWENLYFACGHCQAAKKEKHDELLLRPDADGYSFEKYFIYNFATHTVEANPAASEYDQQRAEVSISIFGFNHPGQKESRRILWLSSLRKAPHDTLPLNQFPFRFLYQS